MNITTRKNEPDTLILNNIVLDHRVLKVDKSEIKAQLPHCALE